LDTAVKHRRYGALASFSTFIPNIKKENGDSIEAWVKFTASPYSYANTRKYQQCRIFYSQNKEPFLNEIYLEDKLADAEIFPPTNYFKVIRWTFDNPVNEILLRFKGASSPEIYGIALDGLQGIAVDNIPLRGCSGLFFTLLDEQLMAEMYKELNVKLFILQFEGI